MTCATAKYKDSGTGWSSLVVKYRARASGAAWKISTPLALASSRMRAANWSLPVLLLQAAADKVVSNHGQNQWLSQLAPQLLHQKVVLPDARHEIFMETDTLRQQAINAINVFLRQLPASR